MVENGSEVEKSANGNEVEKTANGEEPTEIELKIIKQIEYYFGDINLARDKFMQEQVKLDEGWIPMETMTKFNRLAHLSAEHEVILEALKKSKSGLIEVHEDKTKIRRSTNFPLPEMNENSRQELVTRTVYCKGFPLDSTLDQLLEYFQQYKEVINVVMRNYNDKATNTWHFKGSVFINFKTVESAGDFLKLDSVKYNDTDLTRMWMKDYADMKRKERLDEKAKRQKSKKSQKNDDDDAKEEDKSGENEDSGFPSGSVVQLTGFDLTAPIMREKVKETIEGMGISVAYIEYEMGNEFAFVRLEEKDASSALSKKVEETDGVLEVNEKNKLKLRVLEPEEEEKFLKKAKEDMLKRKRPHNKNKGRGFKRGRGGRQNRKRAGSPIDTSPAKKVAA